MGVYLTALRPWNVGGRACIPYEFANHQVDVWAVTRIELFNRAIGKTLFVLRGSEPDYVVFSRSADAYGNSEIGMKGGPQTLGYGRNPAAPTVHDDYTILHEMGHCVGLGHEYFHQGCPWIGGMDPAGLHAYAYGLAYGKYTSWLLYDPDSIMSYPPERLGVPNPPGYILPSRLSAGDVMLIRALYPGAAALP